MNKDQENSDSECDSQAPSEESSTEDIESFYKENSPHESGLSTESNNGEPTDDSSAAKKKSFVRKRWLFPLFLTITIGTGSYFYAQEKGIHLSITLPLDLNKSFPVLFCNFSLLLSKKLTNSLIPPSNLNSFFFGFF